MKKNIFMESQVIELSKYASAAIVTTVSWQQNLKSPVLLTAPVNQIPSSKHLLYLNYLQ